MSSDWFFASVWHWQKCVRVHIRLGKLKREADAHLDNPAELVSLMFGFHGSFLRPFQIPEELSALIGEVRRLKPVQVLEIGTAQGGTLFLWTRVAARDATIVSIDLPGGPYGGGYSATRKTIYQRFARRHQRMHLLRADSHSRETFEKAKSLFRGQIDLLFIDADHSYEGAKKDWEMYSKLVRKGGLIVFHDVAGNYEDTEVKKLWDSIKPEFEHREYIENPGGKYGIGVMFV